MVKELTLLSARTKQPRFKPILDCLRFCRDSDIDHMVCFRFYLSQAAGFLAKKKFKQNILLVTTVDPYVRL